MSDDTRHQEEKIKEVMAHYGLTEAQARVSCAVNANSARNIGDRRGPRQHQEPVRTEKDKTAESPVAV